MTNYQLSINKIRLKRSCEALSLPFLRNEIYFHSIAWEQIPITENEGFDYSDAKNISEIVQNKVKIGTIQIYAPKGDKEKIYLWANDKINDFQSKKPNIKKFSKGVELWRGGLKEGTLHYKIWIWESDSEIRNFAEIIEKIKEELSLDVITKFVQLIGLASPHIPLAYAVASAIVKITENLMRNNKDDLVAFNYNTLIPDDFDGIAITDYSANADIWITPRDIEEETVEPQIQEFAKKSLKEASLSVQQAFSQMAERNIPKYENNEVKERYNKFIIEQNKLF